MKFTLCSQDLHTKKKKKNRTNFSWSAKRNGQRKIKSHVLFFRPTGFACKRAFTNAPTFSRRASSEKSTCKSHKEVH